MATARPETPDQSDVPDEIAVAEMEQSRVGRIILGVMGMTSKGAAGDPEVISLGRLAYRIKRFDAEEAANLEAIRRREEAIEKAQQELSAKAQEMTDAYARSMGEGSQSSTSAEEVEEMIRSQLNALTSPDENDEKELVEPPVYFSPVDTLTTPTKYETRKTFFTCLNAKSKFTGDKSGPSKGELEVVALLESLTIGQNHLKLSKNEFMNVFISACAGAPQTLLINKLAQVVSGAVTVGQIYRVFTDCYFFEMRPEQAMAKLKAIKQKNTFSSLADADLSIRKLAHLASLGEETQERRQLFMHKYYREALLGIIPDKYIANILENITRKKVLTNKTELTPNELLAICRVFRSDLDTYFFRKSQRVETKPDAQAKQASGGGKKRNRRGNGNGDGNVNAVTRSQSQQQNKPPAQNSSAQPSGPKPSNSNNGGNGGNGQRNGNGGNSRPRNGGNGNGNGAQGQNKQTNSWSNKKLDFDECKLCLQTKHTYQNCPLFKDFERIVTTVPCPCPMKGFHLQKFCPIKPKN